MEAHCCRCCLTTKSRNYYNLFEKYKTARTYRTYSENINRLAQVDVELEDGLPQYACGKCILELQRVLEFILIIQKSDEKLRKNLQQRHEALWGRLVQCGELQENKPVLAEDSMDDEVNVCTSEDETLHSVESLHPQPEISLFEGYVKEDNTDDLQMVEEILESDEEIPNDSMSKDTDALHELAHLAATQENVHVDPNHENDNSQEFYYEPDIECDDEYLIEYNPDEETPLNLKPSKWKCAECKKVLRGDVSYEGHMNIHRNTRPYKCTICHSEFRCHNAFKKHKGSRHTIRGVEACTKIEEITIVPIRCSVCNEVCQTEVDLLKHEIIAHNKHSQTVCPLCPDVIVDKLLNHLESEHSDLITSQAEEEEEDTEKPLEPLACLSPNTIKCHLCSKILNSLPALNRHYRLSHNVNTNSRRNSQTTSSSPLQITSWNCDICPEIYSSSATLNAHRKLRHGVVEDADTLVLEEYASYADALETLVRCEICKKKIQMQNLSKHIANHERKNIKKEKTNEIKEIKEKKEQIPQRQIPKLLCSYCPREFKNSKTLNQHEKTHKLESPDAIYVCADCDRQYSSRILFDTHRKQAHKDRDNVCSICGNAFKLKNQLMNHMKLHLEKNIQCPHCDKKYARQFDLNVHLRSHTGEMPFACHLCEKRFAIKVRLTYHLQKHYGIKHQCKECHAEFNSKQKLKAHSFKHTGMPYRCELCEDHGFPNRVVFKRHLDRVHHTAMTDEALNEMFQRNTGKTIKIEQVSDALITDSPENVEIEEVIEDNSILLSSSDIVMETETETEIIRT